MFYTRNGILVCNEYLIYSEQPWVITNTVFIVEQYKSYKIDRDSI